MGLFACLTAVLLLGFILGRGTRAEEPPDQIYLNAVPPTPTPTPTPTSQVRPERASDRRAPLSRVIRRPAVPPASQEPRSPRPTPSPGNAIDGSAEGGSSYVINGGDQGVTSALSAMESEVIRLTNLERKRSGCAPLRVDRRLTRSARAHSIEMAGSGDLSHSSPNGRSPWNRMDAAGYHDGGAENIGRGYTSAKEAVRNWMAASGHRHNILNCELTATGVGVVEGPVGPWWTQDFGYS
jgi:uncharacterized protein YkwD